MTNPVPNIPGTSVNPPARSIQEITATGAITVKDSIVYLNNGSGVIAATLGNPTYDGQTMTIVSMNNRAHTVTFATGVNGAGTSSTRATFSAQAGGSITLTANDGVWYTHNWQSIATTVTFGTSA